MSVPVNIKVKERGERQKNKIWMSTLVIHKEEQLCCEQSAGIKYALKIEEPNDKRPHIRSVEKFKKLISDFFSTLMSHDKSFFMALILPKNP